MSKPLYKIRSTENLSEATQRSRLAFIKALGDLRGALWEFSDAWTELSDADGDIANSISWSGFSESFDALPFFVSVQLSIMQEAFGVHGEDQ